MPPPPAGRDVYRPSGRADAPALALWAGVLAAAGGLGGYALHLADPLGPKAGMVVTGLAALGLGAGVRQAVVDARCRNRGLAAGLAAVVGLILVLSRYQFEAVAAPGGGGWAALHRVDRLPGYLVDRLTDGRAPTVLLVLALAVELWAGVGVPAAFGWDTAGRPFDEETGEWFAEAEVVVAAGAAIGAVRAVADRDPTGLAAALARPGDFGGPHGWVALYLRPVGGAAAGYLTAAEITGRFVWDVRTVARLWELTPAEAAAARPYLPGAAVGLPPDPVAPAGPVAVVVPVPPPFAGRMFTPGVQAALVVIGLARLVVAFGGGLAGYGLAYLVKDWDEPTACWIAGGSVAVFFAALLVPGYDPYAATWGYQAGRFRRLLTGRPGRWVDPADPAARFVAVVPRANQHKPMIDDAADLGLLKVMADRRAVAFEGDRERWLAPAEAVDGCELTTYALNGDEGARQYTVTVRVRTAAGLREVPLKPRQGPGRKAADRRRAAEELLAAIERLRAPAG